MSSARSLIVLLATVAGVGTTASLGRWQLNRAAEKTALHDTMQARAQLPPLGNEGLACTDTTLQGELQRPVRLRGRWLEGRTVWLDNRAMAGRAGLLVLAPFQLAPEQGGAAISGAGGASSRCAAVVLVQRGWVPRNFMDRTQVAPVPTPDGIVELEGRLVLPPSRLMELGQPASQAQGRIRQNVDPAALSAEWGVALRPGSIQQTADEQPPPSGGTGLVREWWQPASDVGRHKAYAAQWFGLAALMAGLYLWFQWLRPRRG
ncbi:MAG: SURF1 family protein [Rubrivivax sp.]|nr:MAG: SURF1 family protein [Rubrivivax sp.]